MEYNVVGHILDWLNKFEDFSQTPILYKLLERLYLFGLFFEEAYVTIRSIEQTGRMPAVQKWQLEKLWEGIFKWLFLGKLDLGSAFFGIPVEVFFHISELSFAIRFLVWKKKALILGVK
jgi:hypothetical protein